MAYIGKFTESMCRITAYAVGGWAKVLTGQQKRKLVSEQRKVQNTITKTYKTVSGPASQVIAGVILLDLEVEKRWVGYRISETMRPYTEGV